MYTHNETGQKPSKGIDEFNYKFDDEGMKNDDRWEYLNIAESKKIEFELSMQCPRVYFSKLISVMHRRLCHLTIVTWNKLLPDSSCEMDVDQLFVFSTTEGRTISRQKNRSISWKPLPQLFVWMPMLSWSRKDNSWRQRIPFTCPTGFGGNTF